MAENERWQQQLIEKLLLETLYEQRRARRWRILFRVLGLLLIMGLFVALIDQETLINPLKDHTALIEIKGMIASESRANADDIGEALRDAFKDPHTQGVILRINSPGGSPVQAGYLYDEIRRLRKEYPKIPIYAVITDLCASGGYYIAAATDAIYADKASLVGSIGAIMGGFGFVGTLEKLGMERRVIAAGEHKALLDPFAPLKPEEQAYAQQMLAQIHAQFVQAVKAGRGARLQDNPELYSGLVWTGDEALKLGLVDGLSDTRRVAREIIKAETIVKFSGKRDVAGRLADRLGASFAQSLAALSEQIAIR